jgi:hypothetical protein
VQRALQQTLSTQKPGVAHCAGVLHAPPMGTGVLVGVAVGVNVGTGVPSMKAHPLNSPVPQTKPGPPLSVALHPMAEHGETHESVVKQC